MFQVTTLDLNDVPKTDEGKVDYAQDFFGKSCNLTVSGQLEANWGPCRWDVSIRSAPRSAPRTRTPRAMRRSSG